jgi:phosphate-selective porin OprO/OprP
MAVLIFVLGCESDLGQTKSDGANWRSPTPDDQPVASSTAAPASAGQPAGEVLLLRSKIDRLLTLVEEQQRTMADMKQRLEALESRTGVQSQPSPANLQSPASFDALTTSVPSSVESRANPTKSGPHENQTEQKPAQGSLTAGWNGDHAFLRSADGDFETFLGGYAQLDFRGYESGLHPPNTMLLRRARVSVEGKVQRYFDFKVEGDFADTLGTLLRDAYVRIHRLDELQLTFGQFKEPISQEELRGDTYQDFVERSLVNDLVPSRSPGLMLSGEISNGVVEYQLGAFNARGLLAANDNGTPETVLRLRFAPWRNHGGFWTRGLAFGGAYARGRSSGSLSIGGTTESRSFTFFQPESIRGRVTRANAEVTWLLGPAAFRAEYDQTNQARNNLGQGGTDLPGVIGKGYTAQFTCLLTGETKPDAGPVTPTRGVFGEAGGLSGFGAWELKFRYSNLQIDDSTPRSNRVETIFFGPNWYLNRHVRYVLDLGFERFKDPLRSPSPGDANFFVVLSRIQVTF